MNMTSPSLRPVLAAAVVAVVIATPAVADSLATRAAAAKAAGAPVWLSWTAPAGLDGTACCWDGRNGRGRSGERACSLAGESFGMNLSDDDEPGHASDPTLVVYARVTASGVDKVRAISASCRMDRKGEAVQELTGIQPAESVAWLAALADRAADASTKRGGDHAMMALAMHADASVDSALERLAREGRDRKTKKDAAFWLGNTRKQAGYEALVRLRASDDAAFREQLTFALSQSPVAAAPATLIDMARNDPSPRVRGQALFWIAQKARKRTEIDAVREATGDPDAEIKKKAVFALSQIPDGEGVPELIRVARENRDREVRKQAMFWLGQSKDPRALAFFEQILSK
jgi:hypothetical protein